MRSTILDNGLTFIYEKREGSLASFCIGFDAGAFREKDGYYGTAHLLEHMLFKGTSSMNENEINSSLDRIFAFNNAMTNYPYVIFYGTSLKEDFYEGFKLYSDILINPLLSEDGFTEERDVAIQESKEWKEDFDQLLEDELLKNGYDKKRIHETIIGNEESIRSITIEELKKFYKKYYVPSNCTISIVASLEYDKALEIVKSIWGGIGKAGKPSHMYSLEEEISEGTFITNVKGFSSAKILYAFDIKGLSFKERECLYIFNAYFGEGVSSKLYDSVRTSRGLSYDVYGRVKGERNIELYTLYAGCNKSEILSVKKIMDDLIENYKEDFIKSADIDVLKRRVKLKEQFWQERTIERAKTLCVDNIMFKRDMCMDLRDISKNDVLSVIDKVFVRKPLIQIIK